MAPPRRSSPTEQHTPMPPAPARLAQRAGQAIERDAVWSDLMQRLALARQCFAAAVAQLPPELAAQLRSGALDDAHWTLLAANSAAAAKLRQILPTIEQQLAAQGLGGRAVRVKVRPWRDGPAAGGSAGPAGPGAQADDDSAVP